MNYLIWTNLYLTLFYGFYWVFLRNETFFNLNRWYFLWAAALAFLLPMIDAGSMKAAAQTPVFISELPVVEIGSFAESPGFPLWLSLYIAGCLVSLIWLLYRFIRIYSSFKNPPAGAAYSFLSSIYIDDSHASHDKMLVHEKVHAAQLHSADILFFELIRTFLWFNPIVHIWIRAAKLNHEYIADRATALGQKDRIKYATLLLQHNMGTSLNNLANNFFNKPFLKKRIAMLFKNQSKPSVAARLLLLIPVIIISFAFQSAEPVVEPSPTSETGTATKPLSGNKDLDQLTNGSQPTDTTTFLTVEVPPKPVGGMTSFYQFIGQNYKYPKAAIDAKIEGRLLIQFVVEKDGSLTDIKVLRDLGHGTGDEAVRMLKSAPKWIPGIQNGKPVRVQFTLPLQLNQPKLQQEKETSEQS